MKSPTVVSCPGKVLISGGYLVLDRCYSGVVVGTTSRFYTVIQPSELGNAKSQQINLTIRSPQFINAEWSYTINLRHQSNLIIKSVTSSANNKFVELAVRESLKLSLELQTADQFIIDELTEAQTTDASQVYSYDVKIDILGDNDFYSQPRETIATIITPFNRLNTSLKDVHKTGLGSSAAMVTSLCSAILIHFTPSIDPQARLTKLLLHNLSQYVHSLAQGKVGSGFDVSAALWGTHVYRRFSPSCLGGLLDSNDNSTPHQLREVLDPAVNLAWTNPSTGPIIEQFVIPKYTTLLLADVDAGSHTPSMVSQVLKWKTEQKEIANTIWNELSVKNEQLKLSFQKLEELAKVNPQDYLSHVVNWSDPKVQSQTQNDDNSLSNVDDVKNFFLNISSLTKSIRKLMKKMGVLSDVPIEPDSQTKLLDECEKLDGVIGTGVPGAGGYDAIWVLIFTPPVLNRKPDEEQQQLKKLINFLNTWPHSSVRVLSPDSWVIGGSRKSESRHEQNHSEPNGGGTVTHSELDEFNDGIQIFDNLQNVLDRLKSQTNLLSF